MVNLDDLMLELSGKRPVFHNERDFQLELGMLLNRYYPDLVRMEYCYPDIDNRYCDIMILDHNRCPFFAIELKYLSKKGVVIDVNIKEKFNFKRCCKEKRLRKIESDRSRINCLKEQGIDGAVIVLSNDKRFIGDNWKQYSMVGNEVFKYIIY